MSWAEVKKINSDLSIPLNELMSEKPNGLMINPVYSGDYKSSNRTYPYLKTYKSTKTISSSYIESSKHSVQRYNELWSHANTNSNILRKVDLLTGNGTNVLTTDGTIFKIVAVTKTYVYFSEYINDNYYLGRYNKDTGEYKKSTISYSNNDYIGHVWYEDNVYAYCTNDDTLEGKGFYKVTDNINSGGVFTYTKLSTNIPSNENMCSRFNSCIRNIIELPNNYILVGWFRSNDYYLYLYRINLTNGYVEKIKDLYLGAINEYAYKYTLCPIRDNSGKIVGVIFGLNRYYLYLYKVNGSIVSILDNKLYTYNTTGKANTEYDVGYYDNGIFYTLDTNSGKYQVDSSLAMKNELPVVFLPKGTKVYQNKNVIYPLNEKIRDCLTVSTSGNLTYSRGAINPNSSGVFTIPKDGLYEVDCGNDGTDLWYLLGTFF